MELVDFAMWYSVGAALFAGLWAWFDNVLDIHDGREVFSVGMLSVVWPAMLVIVVLCLIVLGTRKLKEVIAL